MTDEYLPVMADKIGTLYANQFEGEGIVVLSEEFQSLNYVLQRDLLKDWTAVLSNYYQELYDVYTEETEAECPP